LSSDGILGFNGGHDSILVFNGVLDGTMGHDNNERDSCWPKEGVE
jgi:hypothetical protein